MSFSSRAQTGSVTSTELLCDMANANTGLEEKETSACMEDVWKLFQLPEAPIWFLKAFRNDEARQVLQYNMSARPRPHFSRT